MIELIFVACLTTGTGLCEEKVQAFLPDIGVMGCMMTAQQQLAQWAAAHPTHRIERWSCGWADERPSKA